MQKTAYEMRISDWSSDVCSSDLAIRYGREPRQARCLLYSDIVACGHALCLGGLQLWIIVQCDVDCLCWRRRKARKRRRRLEVDGRHADEPQIVCSARNELRARRLPLATSQDRTSTRLNSSH